MIVRGQNIGFVKFDNINGLEISQLTSDEGTRLSLLEGKPLVSFDINDEPFRSVGIPEASGPLDIDGRVLLDVSSLKSSQSIFVLTIKNITQSDTLKISNIVPMGEDGDHVFITGRGSERLSKTRLYIPDKAPVTVIVPDNAWELGYSSINIKGKKGAYALARRTNIKNGERRRFWTNIYPGGQVEYTIYFDLYTGTWQDALRKCFQEKYLYDMMEFDNSLYEREDLSWIKSAYVIHLIMAWDHHFYDSNSKSYKLDDFVARGEKWYGGDDVIGIWPTWPTLGLDERNQWDLYQDLPGGLEALNKLTSSLAKRGTKLFISYNPWDESTRREDHLSGMSELIRDIDADGVVLDTRGSSSKELQEAGDKVKEGIVMFSEGMAVPKDMPGIIAGRVHNALYYPPILNLNKLIKPDFAIFRVAELTYEKIKREYALAFFNGYGTEINMFKPGQPDWIEDDYRFLGRTTQILRENHLNFISKTWTPLIESKQDGIYINKWPGEDKTVYTIFSLLSEGFQGHLFKIESGNGFHYVDLWNHEEAQVIETNEGQYVNVSVSSFDKKFLGTNNEGAVGCIARLPEYLEVSDQHGLLNIKSKKEGRIKVWNGVPDYSKEPVILNGLVNTYDPGRYEGKVVVQLFDDDRLLDEKIILLAPGRAKLISRTIKNKTYHKAPKGMVKIPSGELKTKFIDGDTFVYYPVYDGPEKVRMEEYFMDKHPVTNKMFEEFLLDSDYLPEDTTNFLKHWRDRTVPAGMEDYPVVYVSINDARAFADWAGKRLPTEIEWQYAAQTEADLLWPWGNEYDSLRSNPGNGKMDPVGLYKNGINPNGLADLVGNVWQLTNDTYESGSYSYSIIKGGSYFKPTSSWWYVKGGPRELKHRQILLHVSDGFDRNGTVGFRCVADAKK
jgi:formylglycine-generating enzyme required for sulfatase activity